MQKQRTKRRPQRKPQQKRYCYFCVNTLNDILDTDATTLRRFTSSFGKIVPRRRSGVCAGHQRKLATAIKRARIAALLPFVVR